MIFLSEKHHKKNFGWGQHKSELPDQRYAQ